MSNQTEIETILRAVPVIPVVIIDDLAHAVPLARALVAGGLTVIEITLRTAHGIGAIGQFHLYFDDLFPTTLGKPLIGS